MITVGCAENIVEVPLFAELGGYGPFLGRRNLGVRDPLYCRVLTVNDGTRRNVVVVTDTISSNEKFCRVLRMELASDFAIYPESIMFMGTHTHSAAGVASCDVGYGEPSAEFLDNWRRMVRKSLQEAIANEEEVRAFAGCAPLLRQLGARRTNGIDQHTDPEIRFVKVIRKDGSVKLLLHNHAMHGVVFGAQKKVSGDWMGAANAKIKAAGMADMPLYLYGTSGDVNVIWTDEEEKPVSIGQTVTEKARERNLEWISSSYVESLKAALDSAEEISLGTCKAALKTFEFPSEPVIAQEYRDMAAKLLAKLPSPFETLLRYTHDRMQEMAVLADRGHDFRVLRDLQVLRMGDLEIMAVPGEPFLAVGEALRENANVKFPIAVSVANGDAGYYPTREMFEKYPNIFCCDDFGAFGFYEVWFGPGLHRPKFKPEIVEFIVNSLLEMEREL